MLWMKQLNETVIFKICIASFWIIGIFYEIGISPSFQFFKESNLWYVRYELVCLKGRGST